ncbi:hypothetical protein BX257_7241 [Streptomyces sp. 3212.3]|nr:hypothetical protein ADL25_23410 [Streptomyces sp. NRRL F-5122]REE64548.1 hypothetical protein BX257_7241 [Streptomyces sp. 3212.3]
MRWRGAREATGVHAGTLPVRAVRAVRAGRVRTPGARAVAVPAPMFVFRKGLGHSWAALRWL